MAPNLATLRRGSIQLQRAAKVIVSGEIGSQQVLVIFVLTGFILCGVVEQSASVALRANITSAFSADEFADYVANTSFIKRYCQHDTNETIVHVVRFIPQIEIPMTQTDKKEAALRQAFMWGMLVSPLVGSRIAARVGAERLYGAGVMGAGVAALLVPASWLTTSHLILRTVQGVFVGVTWPAAHMLAVTWIKEKWVSAFISLYAAVNFGYSLVGVLGTMLVRNVGRDSLSYVIAAMSFSWFFLWWRFVEESLNINHPKRDELRNLPWDMLLISKPAWACGIAVIGSQWADATLMLGVTKYLKLVYGFSVEYESALQALPHMGHFLASITFGILVDYIRNLKIISTTTARKVFVYLSHFPPAALLFVLGYTGCDPTAPAALYVIAIIMIGATPAGAYASAADIAPNFAGTVFGLCQTVGAAGLLAAHYAVSEGLHGSFAGWWRLVFGASSAVLLSTATCFMMIGSGSVQPWNNLDEDGEAYGHELQTIGEEEPSRLDSVLE